MDSLLPWNYRNTFRFIKISMNESFCHPPIRCGTGRFPGNSWCYGEGGLVRLGLCLLCYWAASYCMECGLLRLECIKEWHCSIVPWAEQPRELNKCLYIELHVYTGLQNINVMILAMGMYFSTTVSAIWCHFMLLILGEIIIFQEV